jgi:predicted nucleotidyltransferase
MNAVSADIEAAVRAFFAERGAALAAAYLYGSQARGTARADSDVDIAVLPMLASAGTLESLQLDLEGELERRLGKSVQIVVLDTAPLDLVHRVLTDGILVHERDRSRRIAFEVRARNEYFDLLPILERYRRCAS